MTKVYFKERERLKVNLIAKQDDVVSLDERVQLPTLEKLLEELVVLLGLGCAFLFLEINDS